MKKSYKYIRVISSIYEDEIDFTVAKLYIDNISNVGVIRNSDKPTKDVVIYPGTRNNLEDILESLILKGYTDATLVPNDTETC